MFDISWTEFLLIGVVALIVIGPKELPGVMRTLGQYTRKIRSMAADFQNQFQEALREADMADLKKQVDDMAQGVTKDLTSLDPLKSVREDVESIGKDIEKPLEPAAAPSAGEAQPETTAASAPIMTETAVLPAEQAPLPLEPVPPREAEAVPVTAEPGSTERTG
jgi:sec-independent protein translocase protein TatB